MKEQYYIIEPCTTSNSYEIKLKERKIDIKKAEKLLGKLGTAIGGTEVVTVGSIGNYGLSIYESGRMMIKPINPDKRLNSKEVGIFAEKLMEEFKKNLVFR